MEKSTVSISVVCNAPKGYRGDVMFTFGINDEKIGEGRPDEIVELQVPEGVIDLLVLVTNGSVNSITGTTRLEAVEGRKFKIKYGFITKKAELALRD